MWLADLELAAKTCPVLIVCRLDPDARRALITYVPLTTQHWGSRYEIPGRGPSLPTRAVRRQRVGIGSLVEPRLERKLGQLSPAMMAKVKDAIRFAIFMKLEMHALSS
ncbi:MAG: type II toxin-antitoxin system PemK/MazF family toxin [Nitrospirota bacterium]